MKNLILIGIALTFFACKPSKKVVVKADHDPDVHHLNEGELVKFGKDKKFTGTSRMSRGAYDGSGYLLQWDYGKLTINDVEQTNGKHPNDLSVELCYGDIVGTEKGYKLNVKTHSNTIYLFRLDDPFLLDSFSNNIQVEIEAQTLDLKPCPLVYSTFSDLSIRALPEGVKNKELFKREHPEETIGTFSKFVVMDGDKTQSFSAGDYVIIGADSCTVK